MADLRGRTLTGRKPTLIVMARTPRLGAVKRRLARDIGDVAATGFYRRCLQTTLRRLGSDARWRTVLAVTPDADLRHPIWRRVSGSCRIPRIGQGEGDLGRRMQRLLAEAAPGPAILIGSDVPGIAPAHIAAAFGRLAVNDAIFGPAKDGGYWLIGVRRTAPLGTRTPLFGKVRWSSPHALADSLQSFAGRRIAFAAEMEDVDDGESYRRRRRSAERLVAPATSPCSGRSSPSLR